MALRVSTTGSTVYVNDLGLVLDHPTTNRDISLEFTAEEIKQSTDLTDAIQGGNLTVDDGQFTINANDYNGAELLSQELDLTIDTRFISHDELSAGYLDTPIITSTFPISLNSTASSTRNVYAVGARWGTWQADIDDKVVISGSTAADGTYTIESVTDHQNFIVVESIPDSTGGTISVYHPNASNRIGINDNNFVLVSGQNLQETLESIDFELSQNSSTDELVKVSINDTTAGYLQDKIVGGYGRGISVSGLNDGGDEDLELKPFNLYPIRQNDLSTTIYVRTTGSDTTGDGLIGTPYRTVKRALQDIPYLIHGEQFIIDCTGIGQELVTDPLIFPPLQSTDTTIYNSTPTIPGFVITGPLTIQAEPTLVDTISGVDLTGQTADSVTLLKTLQTNKNYTLNQHRGKFVRDANNVMGVIASNTAGPNSELEISQNSSFTAPIEILEQSAEIRNSSTGNAVEIRDCQSKIQFNGIKFTTASASSWRYGLFVENSTATVGTNACYVDGHFSLNGCSDNSFSNTFFTKRVMSTGTCFNMFSCVCYSATVALRNGGSGATDACFWFEIIFDGCYAVGDSAGINYMNRCSISLDKTMIKNGLSDGVYMSPGFLGRIRRTRIKDCSGNGILAQGTNRGVLLDVTGTGNSGIGLKITDGAYVNEQGTVDITGTGGDYQVGANSVGTWGSYSGDENDLGASSPQICRLFG